LEDTCPQCGGEIVDITATKTGKEFLRIITAPAEIRLPNVKRPTIYATGGFNWFSTQGGDKS